MNRRLSLRFHPPKAWGVSQVLANNPTQKATDEAQVKDLMMQISRKGPRTTYVTTTKPPSCKHPHVKVRLERELE